MTTRAVTGQLAFNLVDDAVPAAEVEAIVADFLGRYRTNGAAPRPSRCLCVEGPLVLADSLEPSCVRCGRAP